MPITIGPQIAALGARRNFDSATASISSSFQKLSSGLRINSAKDDAAGLALADTLNSNSRIFNESVQNVNHGISFLNIAEQATDVLSSTLGRMRELAVQASNEVLSSTQREGLDAEVQALSAEYNRVVESTAYNGSRVFQENGTYMTIQAGYGSGAAIAIDISKTTTTFIEAGDPFGSAQNSATGSNPVDVAVGDFNNDGNDDVLTANSAGNTVSLLLSNGDGTFQSKLDSTLAATGAAAVAVADFNNDGNMDFVAIAIAANIASIFLGNGDGTFDARQDIATWDGPVDLAVGDFNNDSNMDYVLYAGGDDSAEVRLGNGDGTFQAPSGWGAPSPFVNAIAIGDIDNDNDTDIVAVDGFMSTTFRTIINDGSNNYTDGPTQSTAAAAYGVTLADINGDNNLDIIATNTNSTVSVLLGNGDKTFQNAQSFAAGGPSALPVAATDLNNDGYDDVVVGNPGSASISVLYGNADGSLDAAVTYAAGSSPGAIGIGDFNNDGTLDLLAANNSSANVSTFLGSSSGSVTETVSIGLVSDISVATIDEAEDALDSIDTHVQALNEVVGNLGAKQARFEVIVDVLKVQSENYRVAADRIRDLDVASELANVVQSQVRQQGAQAMMAQANQQSNIVTKLLRS